MGVNGRVQDPPSKILECVSMNVNLSVVIKHQNRLGGEESGDSAGKRPTSDYRYLEEMVMGCPSL
jgi:hypothetical protein